MVKLFGTDGVRGVANTELTCELCYNLGRAGAFVLTKANEHSPKIIVGMDTRISGVMLQAALTAGMCSVGAEVISIGVIPTPAIAYLVKKYGADAGVMISASHNPVQDNGIKFFSNEGFKLPDNLEEEIENLIASGLQDLPRPIGGDVGTSYVESSAIKDYSDFLVSTMEGLTLEGLKIAVDCANGATSYMAPQVFSMLKNNINAIHNIPDGKNINSKCGSTHMDSLKSYVKEIKADIGIAFDGDGDRCLLIDEKGQEIDGDQIMSICGNYMKENGTLNNNSIVATIMSNLGFFLMGEKNEINIEKAGVGDRYVLELMRERNYNFGGEQSGHIIFLDYNTTGDGILTALQVLKIMKITKKKLSELNNFMDKLPQVLINAKVKNEKKYGFLSNEKIKNEISSLEMKFAGEGRVLIRPSGTEPLVRVMIEGKDQEKLQIEAKKIADLIESQFN